MSSTYRLALEQYLRTLHLKADLLIDVGGSQNKLPGRTASFDVTEYLIADLPHPHEDSLKPDIILDLNHPLIAAGVNKSAYKYYEKADVVTCFEVMEYVFNPVAAMESIHKLLKPQAASRAYVSFPTVYPVHNPVADDSLRYTEHGIRRLASFAKLDIVDMVPRRPIAFPMLRNFWSYERMRPAKDYDHEVTGWICTFARQKESSLPWKQ
jgi:SAM-dependent methyltransferase